MTLPGLRRRLLLQYLLTVGLLLAAAEGLLYGLVGWSGQRDLDTTLRNEIGKLAAAAELEPDRAELDGKGLLNRMRLEGRAGDWQVLAEDGPSVERLLDPRGEAGALPAVGGDALPAEELRIADAAYDGLGVVRAGRLRTVRRRLVKPNRSVLKPEEMTFDLRVVLDRSAVDEQQRRLGWWLLGGFPVLLGAATLGGVFLIRRAVRPVELAFDRERRFTAAASHELRTPLTALRGEIDVALRRERSPAEYVATLREAVALVGRMTVLVEGLLILARADAAHLLVGAGEASTVALQGAVEETVKLLPGRERVAVSRTAPDDARFVGDHLLLAQAVRNLVENALVHGRGPVAVRIGARPVGGLQLTVEDGGPGIPQDLLAAFNGFRGKARWPVPSKGRAGLGLSIARAIVEAHGGTLALTNRPGAGCLAEIALPGAGSV